MSSEAEIGDLRYSTGAVWQWDGEYWHIVFLARYERGTTDDPIIIALNNTKWWKNGP